MKKLCSRWILHNLTKTQKTDRVTWCNVMLTIFKERASNLVWDIVIGDETCIYCYDPKTKQQSTYRDDPKADDCLFFKNTELVATVASENCRTVNGDRYTTTCLPEVIDEFLKKYHKRRINLHHDECQFSNGQTDK
ncbi:hypothetical protein EVAR_28378_1 [Eumeta japonica]|uniref:Mariner Mos1 transposase n=1 Tax=Eumeta variegata TaxID=151549 RepID=A0A4C1XDJ4_EUMVA|nr:hypothetical protein EVAR_28378_1 [Eumeta japonica]